MTPEQRGALKELCERQMKRSVTLESDRDVKVHPTTVLALLKEIERLEGIQSAYENADAELLEELESL